VSNTAGKAYAMNVITPIPWWKAIWQWLIFNAVVYLPKYLKGLINLSLIHYARWTIVGRDSFPRLSSSQPEEDLHYSYMMFESNFNGSWDQYIDSFSFAIPSGLDMFWRYNVGYPKSIPLHHFYEYIRFNQIETNHYFNAYPCASANDVKSAISLFDNLKAFTDKNTSLDDDEFLAAYHKFLNDNQDALGSMGPINNGE
tara:strand:+ start:909 stop:1505 length:597 start_codon:yes stop_codon:yes gene_type:complete